MATIREIAKISGVSASTASRVLAGGAARSLCNAQTAAHVEQVARQLGFRANYHMRSMRMGRSFAIGFNMEFRRQERAGQVGSWYFDQIREGVEAAAQTTGMNVMVVRPDAERRGWDRGLDYLRDRRLDALIVPRSSTPTADSSPDLETLNIVTVDGESLGFPHVGFNEPLGLAMIARHLRELGHERVLWYGFNEQHNDSSMPREQAFLREAFSVGLSGRVCVIDDVMRVGEGTMDQVLNAGQEGFASYLRQGNLGPFTAVACYNDFLALGAQRALISAGFRVPADVSVVGFDDSWAVFGQPPITTVSHQLFEMGKHAGLLAIEAIADNEKGTRRSVQRENTATVSVKPRLVMRASTGPVGPCA